VTLIGRLPIQKVRHVSLRMQVWPLSRALQQATTSAIILRLATRRAPSTSPTSPLLPPQPSLPAPRRGEWRGAAPPDEPADPHHSPAAAAADKPADDAADAAAAVAAGGGEGDAVAAGRHRSPASAAAAAAAAIAGIAPSDAAAAAAYAAAVYAGMEEMPYMNDSLPGTPVHAKVDDSDSESMCK
jgi:hypothetical protein